MHADPTCARSSRRSTAPMPACRARAPDLQRRFYATTLCITREFGGRGDSRRDHASYHAGRTGGGHCTSDLRRRCLGFHGTPRPGRLRPDGRRRHAHRRGGRYQHERDSLGHPCRPRHDRCGKDQDQQPLGRTNPESYTTSKTEATDLLDGAIHADVISATARLEFDGHNYLSAGHTTFVGLTINGRRISAEPAPDTVIAIPGVGKVVLNHQQTDFAYGLRSFTVTAIRLIVAAEQSPRPARRLGRNRQREGRAALADIRAALRRGLRDHDHGRPGRALGRTALVQLPCGGSDGATVKNRIAGVSEPAAWRPARWPPRR